MSVQKKTAAGAKKASPAKELDSKSLDSVAGGNGAPPPPRGPAGPGG